MCGIAGALGERDSSLIRKMTEIMHHRGPDSHGYFSNADIDLGVQRLSIVDLVYGDQPIYNETRSKAIVYNGEIYNYLELKKELLRKGYHFKTNSDTEVIIHLFEEYGEKCVFRLNGMFSFAIADGNKLFIARDRTGIKPLYFTHIQRVGLFIFASEIKALLQCSELSGVINREALTDTWIFGYLLGNKTHFKDIQCLKPGHYLWVSNSEHGIQVKETEYYKLIINPDNSLDFQKAETKLHALLDKSIREHLQGDVEVGLALSGGIDSTTLAFLMERNINQAFQTFTIADDRNNFDFVYAADVAQHIQSKHTSYLPTFEYCFNLLPSFVCSSEQSQLRLMPFFFLSKKIKKYLKVCFIGEGADELFGGYARYLNPSAYIANIKYRSGLARQRGLPLSAEVNSMVEHLSAATTTQDKLKVILLEEQREQLTRGHLELIDKLSMANSIEARVPFLSNEIIDFANTLPLEFKINDGTGKYILKRMAIKAFGTSIANYASRVKVGFHAAEKNFLSHFFEWCQNNLSDDYGRTSQYSSFFCTYQDGNRILKGPLLMFDLFHYIFFERRGVIPDDFTMKEFLEERFKLPNAPMKRGSI